MESYESLVYDKNMVKEFYHKVLEGLENYEVSFVSVAARNKYLTPEEKAQVRLGHTCMLGKTVVKVNDAKKYLDKVLQLDAASNFYTDFNGNYLPRHCMVVYANVNPTSAPKATYEFKKLLADYDKEALCLATVNDPDRFDNLLNRYKNLHNNMMTCYQTQRSRKRWVDVDCDVTGVDVEKMFESVKEFCTSHEKFYNVHPVGVVTHGGLHVLLNTDGLKDNPEKVVEALREYVKSVGGDYKEVLINKNEMLPVPGTLQGGAKVRMLV